MTRLNKILPLVLSVLLNELLPTALACNAECDAFCADKDGTNSAICAINQCVCTCNNVQQNTNAGECTLCFSSMNTVDILGKGKQVPMSELKVGEQVLTGNNKYETVYSIDHRHPTKAAKFVQLHIASTNNDNSKSPLELTHSHMVFVQGNANPVPANAVKVGDHVQTLDGPTEVIKISEVTRDGVYSPLTADGTIVVNGGIVASTYAAFLSNTEWITIAGYNVMSHQSLFNKILKPYRLMCTGISLELCKTNNEKVAYSMFGANALSFLNQQHETIQAIVLLLVIASFFVLDLILSPYSILMIAPFLLYFKTKQAKAKML